MAKLTKKACEDELARRGAQAIGRRLKAAHFEAEATLEGYDFAYNPMVPAALVRDLARLEFVAAGEAVILYGPVGGQVPPRSR